MERVRPVLVSMSEPWTPPISGLAVNEWMIQLRAIPYRYSVHWQTPMEVTLAQTADCKGKAVALYAAMRRSGATNVRVVIGKHHIYDTPTHAWLEWHTTAGSFTLDPTFNEAPLKTAELDPMTYVPLYAYDQTHKYRMSNTGFPAPTARVATGVSNQLPVSESIRTNFSQMPLTPPSFLAGPTYATSYLIDQKMNAQFSHSDGMNQPRPATAAPMMIPTQTMVSSSRNNPTARVRHSTSQRGKHSRVRTTIQRRYRDQRPRVDVVQAAATSQSLN